MAKNWAIAIGINDYSNLQSLQYAKRDAECMQGFFLNEAGFEEVFLFTEDSPKIPTTPSAIPTQPTYGNLRRFFRAQFEEPLLEAGDNLWFFFAGHGQRHADGDYLMPCDADPGDVEHTAIPLSYVTQRLRRWGADNVVLMLDACRNEGARGGQGIGYEQHQGVITIFSCSPQRMSYEIEEIQQGSFTHALLEGLRIQGEGNCATVERLYQYLRYRVPEINRQYRKPQQMPYAIAEPATKLHLILLPRYATLKDIDTLKRDAYKAEAEGDYELAKQLWIRVNVAATGSDTDVITALQRIFQRLGQPTAPSKPQTITNETGVRSSAFPPPLSAPAEPKVESLSEVRIDSNQQQVLKQIPNQPEVMLPSERGVDYTKLCELLAAKQWREADQETAIVMLKVSGRERAGWLDLEHIKNFPCSDLRTIDSLWEKFSTRRFSFSMQKRIWQDVSNKSEADFETYCRFGTRVGWCKQGDKKDWLAWDNLTFQLNAPLGHLPYKIIFCVKTSEFLSGHKAAFRGKKIGFWGVYSIALRLVSCNIQ
jgi:uncharacterized caspase-like protein